MALTANYEKLFAELDLFYHTHLQKECKVLRKRVLDSSKRSDEFLANDLFLPGKLSLDNRILLMVISWWMPSEVRPLLQLKLEESWGGEFQEYKDVCLISRDHALGVLLVSNRWSDRDFYGNILKEGPLVKLLSGTVPKRRSIRVRKRVRRRGYQDHGSLRPVHKSVSFVGRKLLTSTEQLLREAEKVRRTQDLILLVEERLLLAS